MTLDRNRAGVITGPRFGWASFSLQQSVLALALSLFTAQGALEAQSNRCADCHSANASPNQAHLSDFHRSAHSTNLTCATCHQGDESTYDSMRAHAEILSPVNPASPIHYQNLPRTCGNCHQKQFEAFKESHHWKLLLEGDRRAPTCATCHSDAGGFLLSSRGLERTCNRCHSAKRKTARPTFPGLARENHEQIDTVRDLLSTARKIAKRNRNQQERKQWLAQVDEAEKPLREAIASIHRFTFEDFDRRIEAARDSAEAVLEQIANR